MKKLEVKESRIKGAGNGLFAGEDIKAGEVICCTFQKLNFINSNEFEKQFEQTYCNSQINHRNNGNTLTVYNYAEKNFYRIATENIKRGEEFFSDYQQTIDLINGLGYHITDNWLWFAKK